MALASATLRELAAGRQAACVAARAAPRAAGAAAHVLDGHVLPHPLLAARYPAAQSAQPRLKPAVSLAYQYGVVFSSSMTMSVSPGISPQHLTHLTLHSVGTTGAATQRAIPTVYKVFRHMLYLHGIA